MAMLPDIGAFADWSTNDRYGAGGPVPSLDRWRLAAGQAGRTLDQAWLDGKR